MRRIERSEASPAQRKRDEGWPSLPESAFCMGAASAGYARRDEGAWSLLRASIVSLRWHLRLNRGQDGVKLIRGDPQQLELAPEVRLERSAYRIVQVRQDLDAVHQLRHTPVDG